MSFSRRAFLASAAAGQSLALLGQDQAFPIVEVAKPLFAREEQIRIWVGIHTFGPIPEEKRKPGVLHVTRPDGIRESLPVSWPIDGPAEIGWKGGMTLDNSSIMPGLYRLSFEWDRKQSPEAQLTVCKWDQRDRISTRWVFEGDDFQHAIATLRIENHTFRTLRFCHLGIPGADVWLSCVEGGPRPYRDSTGYPRTELSPDEGTHPSQSADDASWQNLNRRRLVTVQPNGEFSQALPLTKAQWDYPVRTPEVEIATVLNLFLGEPSDEGAELFPVRLEVRGKHKFV